MSSNHQLFLTDEEDLIQQAVEGDLEAFNQLVLAYQDLAYRHAYALLGESASAEDATQESFIKAYLAIKQFRGGSFRAWLLKIVTHTVYDLRRQSQRHPTLPLFPEDEDGEEWESPSWLVDPAPSVESRVEQSELSQTVHRLVNELPSASRSVVTLVDLYELDYAEAAQALGIPIGTVKSRLARGRLQLKSKLEGGRESRRGRYAPKERSWPETWAGCWVGNS